MNNSLNDKEKLTNRFNFHNASKQTIDDNAMLPSTSAKMFIDGTADKKKDKFAFATPPKAVIANINLNSPFA